MNATKLKETHVNRQLINNRSNVLNMIFFKENQSAKIFKNSLY